MFLVRDGETKLRDKLGLIKGGGVTWARILSHNVDVLVGRGWYGVGRDVLVQTPVSGSNKVPEIECSTVCERRVPAIERSAS